MGQTRVSVGLLGLAAVEKAVAHAMLSMDLPGAVPMEPYALSEVRAADVMVVDLEHPKAAAALAAYRERHKSTLLVTLGTGELPEGPIAARLPRPLSALALHDVLSQLGAEVVVSREASTNTQAEFADACVLLADAEPARMNELRSALARVVGRIVLARSGAEAAEQIAQASPHVVVLDATLQGPDANALCEAAKATANAAVIMLVDADASTDQSEAMKAGCDTYLIRPVNQLILQEVVAEYLDER